MTEQVPENFANFGARSVALVIDFVLLAAIQVLLYVLPASQFNLEILDIDPLSILTLFSSYLIISFAGFGFLHLVYFTVFHAWTGQTIGKMIMGIKVVAEDRKLISPAVSFLRWTGYTVSFLPLAAGFLWAAVDREHCTWHDRLAQTRVVTAEMT